MTPDERPEETPASGRERDGRPRGGRRDHDRRGGPTARGARRAEGRASGERAEGRPATDRGARRGGDGRPGGAGRGGRPPADRREHAERRRGADRSRTAAGRPSGPRTADRRDRPERPREPHLPDAVVPQMLDRAARARLRTLGKNNADLVARHLVMAGRLLDTEPDLAYEHAHAALRRAGRVDVVREAVALTAYATGAYAEALREVRTVRRLSGIDAHRPLEADCERGLGRPERALTVVAETDPATLTEEDRAELAIVASGARADLGEHEAGLLVLDSALTRSVRDPALLRRLDLVRADRLAELGRVEEAAALRAAAGPDEEEVVVHDLEQGEAEDADEGGQVTDGPAPAASGPVPDADAERVPTQEEGA